VTLKDGTQGDQFFWHILAYRMYVCSYQLTNSDQVWLLTQLEDGNFWG